MHVLLMTENDCYQKGETIVPKGVMIHSTGANNPWLLRYVGPDDGLLGENLYGNHWNRPGLAACVHAFIGRRADGTVDTYQTLPWNYRGWHCGRSGNDTHISFEICEDGLTDEDYFRQTYQAAVELTAYLCQTYGLDPMAPGVVVDHAEGNDLGIASNHSDVRHWWSRFGATMDDFRQDVDNYMKGMIEMTMSKEELRKMIEEVFEEQRSRNIYPNLDDVPDWARPAVEKLVTGGIIQGDGNALNLSYDFCRIITVLKRANLLDNL